MKYSIDTIIDFLKDLSCIDNIKADTDIFNDLGMVGDDFHEMIENYAKTFSVDMKEYLWYFHADEEGAFSLGGLIFPPPYERVKRIPVTPKMLCDFANEGKWHIQYPAHKIPKKRNDMLINKIILVVLLLALLIWGIIKLIMN